VCKNACALLSAFAIVSLENTLGARDARAASLPLCHRSVSSRQQKEKKGDWQRVMSNVVCRTHYPFPALRSKCPRSRRKK
jgi:hypothetical protein